MSEELSETLYRFFDKNKRLLYVGISNNFISRLNQHYKNADWFSEISFATFEHYASRADVEAAELKAIVSESPIHNKAFSGTYESPFDHFQKIKSWVYSEVEPDDKHSELITELKITYRFDDFWQRKTSHYLAFYLQELLPVITPNCEICANVFHSKQINEWADKKRREKKNATN